jgi:beta-glucosidase
VKKGLLSEEVLNQRVREVLNVKFNMGLFDNPYTGNGAVADKEAGFVYQENFIDKVQSQSMVLLKNENDILPLDKTKINKILVTGPLADETNFMISRYGPNGLDGISLLKGLQEYLGADKVIYEKGCEIVDANWPESEIIPEPLTAREEYAIRKAVEAAENVDYIICCLGEDDLRTGEGRSRTSLDLPGKQRDLLQALYKTKKPIILVLVNGQPLTINWENKYIPAILETWFPTFRGGHIVAKMLFGELSPSGRLPITFPKTIGEIEWNFPFKRGSHNAASWWSAKNTRVNGSLYPFGYGLGYTKFEYNNLNISYSGTVDGDIHVSVDVTNTGKKEGEDVVQLYVSDLITSVVYYESVLRGFERVSLKPGETKTVKFTLHPEDLQILDKNMKWTVEPGEFEIRIGANAEDIKVKQIIELK